MPRLALGLRAFSVCSLLVGVASAQPAGNLPIDAFRPAMDSRGYLTVNASQVLGHGELSFGLGSLSWGHRLLEFQGDNGATYTVDDIVTATLVAAVGLKLGPAELEFGASVPLSIMAGDRGPDDLGALGDPNDDQLYKLDGQGIGNVGLHLKTRFLKSSRPPHVGIGLIASLYLPTATKDAFLGEAKLTPQIMGILDKEFGRERRLRISLNAGMRLRQTTTFTDAGEDGADPTMGTITASAEIPFGAGIAYAISKQKFDVVGELIGSVPLGDHADYQPLEAVAGVKLYLARNSFLSLGAGRGLMPAKGANPDVRAFIGIVFEPSLGDRDGDSILDNVDKCPDDPEDFDDFQDEDGCPDLDNDNDRILDVDDLCPNDPEDYDSFEDEDGCPDTDNDKDMILDVDDKCPNEKETYNNVDDKDGCPDEERGVVKLKESEIITMKPINFKLDSDVIESNSFYILDAVVATMKGNPDISLIEVAGHTDEQGSDAHNLDLSERRAASVVRYLTEHGVEDKRLGSQGYGESIPKIDEHTQRAYAINRRVEFVILKRELP